MSPSPLTIVLVLVFSIILLAGQTQGLSSPTRPPASTPADVRSELRALIARRTQLSEKEAILDRLSELRSARGRGDAEGFNAFTDLCLEVLDEERGPVSTCISKLPIVRRAVPSFRVNLLLLRRVMELTDASVDQQTRRNTLAVSLAQLKNRRGVSNLLSEAERRTRNAASMDEMLSRTPEGLETPDYRVVQRYKDWEIREYDEFSVCSTTNVQGFTGFQTLAGYIFGNNKEEEKMAMTTPVFMTDKKMCFVMPSDYWKGDLNSAPTPVDSSVVKEAVEKRLVAVLWYGGVTTKTETARRKVELRERIAGQDDYVLEEAEDLLAASYNDPFTAPWKRRNEVLAVVRRAAK
mmetsp:Transcript_23297/g.48385  ORF Transcript_23297/g.48385 Transcript_23297/m.48385 type:complete len:350 (+) Transcript_23297:49-1098(+)